MSKGKSFLLSKTFWVNLISLGILAVQHFQGYAIPPEQQAMILAAINGALRFVTKEPVTW